MLYFLKKGGLMKLAMLCGGHSSERPISFKSARSIVEALGKDFPLLLIDSGRSEVFTDFEAQMKKEPLPPSPSLVKGLLSHLENNGIEKVCIMLHGGEGEDGHIQGLLDLCRLPYTGSGMGASFLGMDKGLSKMVMEYYQVPTPPWTILNKSKPLPSSPPLPLPLIVKPVHEGSTVGLTKTETGEQWEKALHEAFKADDSILIEQFIPGRELTLTVDETGAWPPVEIRPKKGLYDYESKYSKGMSQYICPAEIAPPLLDRMNRDALLLYEKMGLKGVVRFDIRLDDEKYFFLEVNTLPGMTSLSLVPMSFKAGGLSYLELIERIFHG